MEFLTWIAATSWVEITHDAVKIGLGALIGGGFSLWVALMSSKNRRKESLVEARRNRLFEISEKFITLDSRIAKRLGEYTPLNENPTEVAGLQGSEAIETYAEVQREHREAADSAHTADLLELRSMIMGLRVIRDRESSKHLAKYLQLAECLYEEDGSETSLRKGIERFIQSHGAAASSVIESITDKFSES